MNAIAQAPFTVPFTQANHLILIEAVADGRKGHFILDTGAGDIILHEKYFSTLQTGEEIFEDINGQGFRLRTGWVNLSLGALSRKNEKAFIVDLRQLEKVLGRNLFGKIGTHFFRKTELEIDYAAQELRIHPSGWEERNTGKDRPAAVWTVDMKMKGHIPYLQSRVDGKTVRLGLDTGAEVNVVNERGSERLNGELLQQRQVAVWAVGDQPTVAKFRQLLNFQVGGVAYAPMATVTIPTLPFNNHLPGPRLDGILGFPFFSQHRIALDFEKRTISFRQLRKGAERIPFMADKERKEN